MERSRRRLATLTYLLAALAAAGEGDWAQTQQWRDAAYPKRFFLEVRPPGAAGAGTLPDPETASVLLPLKAGEPLLLVSEDGAEQPVAAQPAGNEVLVIFNTRSGLRRLCLYAGAAKADVKQSPPLKIEVLPGGVRMRGCSAPSDFVFAEGKPLTLERFQALAKAAAGGLGPRYAANVDDPECPFFQIQVGIFGHVGKITNPERYAAVYEGLLRAPVAGQYRFCVDTLATAHLLINGTPVISAPAPDPQRPPFALSGAADLPEGVHRVMLYYAESNPPGQTNVNLGLFGVRLHWQPPFAQDMLCIPAQAFVRHLPAVVTRMESGSNSPQPFINVESVGQALAGASRGGQLSCERVMLIATPTGTVPGTLMAASGTGEPGRTQSGALAAWVPAGKDVTLALQAPTGGGALATRTVNFPVLGGTSPELLDLEGEFAIKSAPDFLYPDETAHIHLETMLSPRPVIIPKERHETRLLPPPARPMGQFRLQWWRGDDSPESSQRVVPTFLEATPLEGGRRRRRVSLGAQALESGARTGRLQFLVRLCVGGAEVNTVSLRVLHEAEAWPGVVQAGPEHLFFSAGTPGQAEAAALPEQVVILISKESESEYRKFAPLKRLTHGELGKEAFFLGDPLVEGVTPKANAGELFGVAKALAAALPGVAWKGVCIPGPHRHLPAFRMLADLEAYVRTQPGGKLPALAVVSLGGGDVARQTPLYTFERALDTLITRLRLAGVQRIVVAGVLPEPSREKQCDTYQERVSEVLRQHHVESVDVFDAWVREGKWSRRYLLEGAGSVPLYGAVPNSQARDEITRMIRERL